MTLTRRSLTALLVVAAVQASTIWYWTAGPGFKKLGLHMGNEVPLSLADDFFYYLTLPLNKAPLGLLAAPWWVIAFVYFVGQCAAWTLAAVAVVEVTRWLGRLARTAAVKHSA